MAIAASLRISGRVQGVGYRFFVQGVAQNLGLSGWVRNLPDGDVEAFVEGSRAGIDAFIRQLEKGPPLSRVERVSADWQPAEGRHASFSIR